MKVTFLSASVPLTKTYIFDQGQIDSTPYPLTKRFSSHEEQVSSLEELYEQIMEHGQHGHCMLKGHLIRSISMEPRAGLMASQQTLLLVLDFDGLDPQGRTMDDILAALDLGDTSYIIQYSASQGIKDGLNAHVFMILDKLWPAGHLKEWLKWKNLSLGFLKDQLYLTKPGTALHWPLDITLAENHKLIYIAPPKIIGAPDPWAKRMELVQRTNDKASLTLPPANIDADALEVLKQLRAAAGYPEHKLQTKYEAKYDAEILRNPGKVSITGVKRQDTFTYVNINGGDSWGYYHLTQNPEVLHNFKGEPAYLLMELCPDYYKEANQYSKLQRRDAHIPTEDTKAKYFVINERSQGKYWKVSYDPEEGVRMDPAPTAKHVADFCTIHGMVVPDPIHDWDIVFDPTDLKTIDTSRRRVNTYNPTKYRRRAQRRDDVSVQPYLTLTQHVLGGCEMSLERFLNWNAFIWQTGLRPQTAWLLHGTFGTGKGTLANILRELYGGHYVQVTPEGIADKFNSHLAIAQIVFLDEVSTDAWNDKKANTILKSLIAGVYSKRAMRTEWDSKVEPYFGLIAAANEFNPVEIQLGDRRWNVPPRQEVPIRQTDWFSPDLIDQRTGLLFQEDQLQAFADYLMSWQVDVGKVLVPMETEAKRFVMQVTQNMLQDITQAFNSGNAEFFVSLARPVDGTPSMDDAQYRQVVDRIMHSSGEDLVFSTDDLKVIFEYVAGLGESKGRLRFRKALSHSGLEVKNTRVPKDQQTHHNGRTIVSGCKFPFTISNMARELWTQINEQKPLHVVKTGTDDG
jgi:hypothetical protein